MAEIFLISSDKLGYSFPVEAVEFSTYIKGSLDSNNPPGNQVAVDKPMISFPRKVIKFLRQQMMADGVATEVSTVYKENPANNKRPEEEIFMVKHKGNAVRNVVYFLTQQTIRDEEKKRELNDKFLKGEFCNLAELFATALASHDLGIQLLEELMCDRIDEKRKNMSVEDVGKEFESYTDLTREQRARARARYQWAFQGFDRNVAPGEGSASAPAPPPSG